jgi:hypothetical protein
MADGERTPVELQRVRPLLFGWLPPLGALGIGLLGVVGGCVLVAADHTVGGVILLVLGAAAIGLYAAATPFLRPVRAPRRVAWTLTSCRSQVRVAGAFARAWSSAALEIASAALAQRRTAKERDGVQHALGGAVYRDDGVETANLLQRMRALDDELRSAERRSAMARSAARSRVESVRGTEAATEILRGWSSE